MNHFKLFIASIICCTFLLGILTLSYSQPAAEFLHNYDAIGDEYFYDIYAVSDSGFIMCGYTRPMDEINSGHCYVVRTDRNGQTLWETIYEGSTVGYSIIETDNGNFLLGIGGADRFRAMLINEDGESLWSRNYSSGSCNTIIELKSGHFVLGGSSGGYGKLMLVDVEGDPLWAYTYSRLGSINSLRETDGGVVAAGYGEESFDFWALKVDEEDGQIVWDNVYEGTGRGYSLVSSGDGGFVLCGGSPGIHFVKISDEGDEQFHQSYQDNRSQLGHCIVNTGNNGYSIVGWGYVTNGDNEHYIAPMSIRTSSQGTIWWRQLYNIAEQAQFTKHAAFTTAVMAYDGSIVAAGYATTMPPGTNAIIMKLSPPSLEPIVMYHAPLDTAFSVLLWDTTRFAVVAENPIGGVLEYEWYLDDDVIGSDTTVTIEWEELGDYIVECRVSGEEFSTTINWHVSVTRLYIDSHVPHSLSVVIPRNTTVDFRINSRMSGGGFTNYDWKLDGEAIPRAYSNNTSILFERERHHEVEAVASLGQLSDNVVWQVTVEDLIVDYWPREFEFEVFGDTIVEFMIEPFDREDDSLAILWTLNGDSITNRRWAFIGLDTTVLGANEVTVQVSDDISTDSMTWNIWVSPAQAVDPYNLSLLPNIPTLYPPSPNPFNSHTTVRYALPASGQVRLELFDINGRLVTELINQQQAAGWHDVVVGGSELVSGVYLVRMTTQNNAVVKKVVLMR